MAIFLFMGSVGAQNCSIPNVNIYYNFEGLRLGCESGPLKISINFFAALGTQQVRFVIPNTLNNAVITDVGDFTIPVLIGKSTPIKGTYLNGFDDFEFTIKVIDYSLGVEIPIIYSYSLDGGITWQLCEGKPILIPAIKNINGDVNLSDINNLPTDPLLPANISTTKPQWIRLNGTLNIDEDYTFGEESIEGSSNIILENDSKIVIDGNSTLKLFSSYLHGCTSMWDGVYSTMGGRLEAARNLIQDSHNGLVVDQTGLGSQQIVANVFKDNGIGIQIPWAPLRSVENDFLGNKFEQNGLMLETIPETYGMKIFGISNSIYTLEGKNGVAGFVRPSNIFDSNTYGISQSGGGLLIIGRGNVFRNNVVGLSGNRSNINIPNVLMNAEVVTSKNTALVNWRNGDAEIRNVETSFFEDDGPDENFIVFNSINGGKLLVEKNRSSFNQNGIFVNASTASQITIKSNNFEDGYYLSKTDANDGHVIAINALNSGSHSPWIIRNNRLESVPWFSTDNVTKPMIQMYGTSDTYTYNNDISGTPTQDGYVVKGGFNNNYNCNYLDGVNNGVTMESTAYSSVQCNPELKAADVSLRILGDCDESIIRGNEFWGGAKCMEYGSPTFTTAITGPQPAFDKGLPLDLLHGNVFGGPKTLVGAEDFNDLPENAEYSYFKVDDAYTNHYPSFNSINPEWFTYSTYPSFFCNGDNTFSCEDGPTLVSFDELTKYRILLDSLSYSMDERWNIERRIFEWHKNRSSDPVVLTYVSSLSTDPMNNFFDFDGSINSLGELHSTEINLLNVEVESRLGTIDTINVFQIIGGVPVFSPTSQYRQLKREIDSLASLITFLQLDRDTILHNSLPSLAIFNQSILVTLTPQFNQKNYNRILLKHIAGFALSSFDSTQLRLIGEQCPFQGGRAVYSSRAMFKSLYDLDLIETCVEPRVSKPKTSQTNTSILKEVIVYDLKGTLIKVIKSLDEHTWRNTIIADLGLEAGMYILTLRYLDGSMNATKIIVQ